MKNLNITIHDNCDSIGLQFFDFYYAYQQSKSADFVSDVDIEFNNTTRPDCINILFASMPESELDIDRYDLVLLDNADEPLSCTFTTTGEQLIQHDNVYVLANSIFPNNHPMHKKIIYYGTPFQQVQSYYFRPFYPQYFCDYSGSPDKDGLTFVNGANRSVRHHIMQQLATKTDINIHNKLSSDQNIIKTVDSFFETDHDRKFRDWANDEYPESRYAKTNYYNCQVPIGIDNKFGTIPPGYFMMDCYLKSHCVIFPESSWINHELSITEKSIKCFLAKTFAFPVAGAGVNQLYNKLGFYTAWNLLPDKLKQFDHELDHQRRYEMITDAVLFLSKNQNLFETDSAKNILDHNYVLFVSNNFATIGVNKFDEIIKGL